MLNTRDKVIVFFPGQVIVGEIQGITTSPSNLKETVYIVLTKNSSIQYYGTNEHMILSTNIARLLYV